MGSVFLDGNEAVARAAMAAGCNFFAGYPITPATSIFHHMLDFLPPAGGVCLQGEDEIASIGCCLGAAAGGARVMTATSGPGMSLFSEQISFAIGAEIPIVIVDVQRLGPSTGSATKGADGDIQFLRWGNSGGLPVIVLAPENVREAFSLTIQAFNLAQRYHCPVFIASNKELAMTRESIDIDDLQVQGVPLPPVPGKEQLFRLTSSTHGRDNYITTDTRVIEDVVDGLAHKLETVTDELSPVEFAGDGEEGILLVVYGVTARAAREAVSVLQEEGQRVALMVIKTLFPVPEKVIALAVQNREKVVVIEMNLGQYVREIRRLAGTVPVHFFGQMNGELISPETIVREVGT
ncbi:transketolase C-terminal domain-containing protein [Desulforhopalus sp. 52FAK]